MLRKEMSLTAIAKSYIITRVYIVKFAESKREETYVTKDRVLGFP